MVIINLRAADLGDRDTHRSLLNLLLRDDDVRSMAEVSVQPVDREPDRMGPSLEVIELAVNSAFQVATLALVLVEWVRETAIDSGIVIERDGTTTRLSPEELRDQRTVERALLGVPNPARSSCVLIGMSRYTHLDGLPAVSQNLEELFAALTDPEIWGVPAERCRVVPDPESADAVLDAVALAANAAEDTLLVYYAGHGLYDANTGQGLHLALRDAAEDDLGETVPWEQVRELIDHSGAARRVVILDCCYSGQALAGDALPDLLTAARVTGTYMMAAAPPDRSASSPSDEECTAFTGELVAVLREGISARTPATAKKFLTLKDVYVKVRNGLAAKGRPWVKRQDADLVGMHPFFSNLAYRPPEGGGPSRSGRGRPPLPRLMRRLPRLEKRSHRLGAGALGVVLLTALSTTPLWWPEASASGGSCSSDARLAWVSDALDQARFEGTTVGQLSALTMIDNDRALTLSDSTPPRLYELSLGADRPAAKINKVTPLLGKDGSMFPADRFDGEGLVAQHSTVLVSTEAEPSIVQFDRDTGREKGRIALPPQFRTTSQGGQADKERGLEGLSLSPNEKALYAAMEAELTGDGSSRGRPHLRILRFEGSQGTDYRLKKQFAYRSDAGLNITEVLSFDTDRLLVLERAYIPDVGNTIRVYRVSLTDARDVSRIPLRNAPDETFVRKDLLFDLARCPETGAPEVRQPQPNRLLDNVEGMTLGPALRDGWQRLYMVSDNNYQSIQRTMIYAMDVKLR